MNPFIHLYYGFGVRFIFDDGTIDEPFYIGPREIFGLSADIISSRLEFFGELSVTVIVFPEVFMGVGIISGMRYYF